MVYIVGGGLGNTKMLTLEAIDVIKASDIVLSSVRISKEISEINSNIKVLSISEMIEFINEKKSDSKMCVIATGDVCFHSIALTLKRELQDLIELKFINGISSMQYLCSKLLIGYNDIKLLSLHGKNKFIVPYVCYNEKVFCLTGGKNSVRKIIDTLLKSGLSDVLITVGERLSYDDERITTKKAREFEGEEFDELSVMVITNNAFVNPSIHLCDDDFIRGKTPMSKDTIRSLSVDFLSVSPNDIVYDIGAGTGSVTICLARKATESIVYAIEKDDDAIELVDKNIKNFGANNIIIVKGKAPAIENDDILPPNKVFIGGSAGNLGEILQWVLDKNKFATIVVNALTIETLTKSIEWFNKLEMNYEVTCVNTSISQKLGRYTMMKAQNPIYIIKGEYKGDN